MKKILLVLGLGITAFSCQKELVTPNNAQNEVQDHCIPDVSNDSVTLKIGSIHEGGRIFYLDGNGGGKVVGRHENYSQSLINWYDAVDMCLNSTFNGYSNWYLPSLDELKLIRDSLMLKGFNTANSSWLDGEYWSSTEMNLQSSLNPKVWAYNMYEGDSTLVEKQADWSGCEVLSVRKF